MADYNNTNKGVLFKNKDKKTDRHPDYNGSAEVVCPHCGATSEHWLASWINTARSGAKYMSLIFASKDENNANRGKAQAERNAAAAGFDDFDDDIPF
jgi:hypothetical protein